jgi:hypothetical protein
MGSIPSTTGTETGVEMKAPGFEFTPIGPAESPLTDPAPATRRTTQSEP